MLYVDGYFHWTRKLCFFVDKIKTRFRRRIISKCKHSIRYAVPTVSLVISPTVCRMYRSDRNNFEYHDSINWTKLVRFDCDRSPYFRWRILQWAQFTRRIDGNEPSKLKVGKCFEQQSKPKLQKRSRLTLRCVDVPTSNTHFQLSIILFSFDAWPVYKLYILQTHSKLQWIELTNRVKEKKRRENGIVCAPDDSIKITIALNGWWYWRWLVMGHLGQVIKCCTECFNSQLTLDYASVQLPE